jgi:hypothetical protein
MKEDFFLSVRKNGTCLIDRIRKFFSLQIVIGKLFLFCVQRLDGDDATCGSKLTEKRAMARVATSEPSELTPT